MADETRRELIIVVPLPQDKGLRGDGRPRVHRFRSQWLELGQQLREFRVRYRLTQAEVAQAVGAAGPSTIAQWENGTNVPEGLRRERLVDFLEGPLWPTLRAQLIADNGFPAAWERAARWYRHASRERKLRDSIGVAVASILDELRTTESPAALREHYQARDGEWVLALGKCRGPDPAERFDLRRLEDAAYGLRWLELGLGLSLDLHQSLAQQLSPGLLNEQIGRAIARIGAEADG